MPRVRREKALNRIYHLMVRGNNKQDIFLDTQDRDEYLVRLKRYKEKYQVKIYAYCLMTNHIHLLIYDNGQDISKFMQGLNLSYVIYFNKKYGRTGHLFQDRFTSVMVNNDTYFLHVSKYIHLNPVKANMVNRCEQYLWSSCNVYYYGKDKRDIIDDAMILSYFAKKESRARVHYRAYMEVQDIEDAQNEVATTGRLIKLIEHKHLLTFSYNKAQLIIEGIILSHQKMCSIRGLEALDSTKLIRNILLYIIALTQQLNCRQIGDRFCMKEATVRNCINKVVSLKCANKEVASKIEQIIEAIKKLSN